MSNSPRLIAYYLPQFHPIEENNSWWGSGFTEWTNTAKAKPRFLGHYQPHVPADLGFYDLRLPETRLAQAELAKEYGIEGFCYYHYWFGNGKRLLEHPFNEVLISGQPNFPFCLCWANDTWSGIWHGEPNRVLIKQEYPGPDDDEKHFSFLLQAFKDSRYICVNNCPVFIVWRPLDLPNTLETTKRWRAMAKSAGLPGLHLVGIFRPGSARPEELGFDASIYNNNPPLRTWGTWRNPLQLIYNRIVSKLGIPTIVKYDEAMKHFLPEEMPITQYPSVIHAWDNTPRSGVNGLVFSDSSPKKFGVALRKAFNLTREHKADERLIFLKSWNEWAEGNHLEPDLRDGNNYLATVKKEIEINSE